MARLRDTVPFYLQKQEVRMKKLLLRALPLFLIFCLLCPMTAFADTGGSGNIDGGGGGMGSGTSTNSWNGGMKVCV